MGLLSDVRNFRSELAAASRELDRFGPFVSTGAPGTDDGSSAGVERELRRIRTLIEQPDPDTIRLTHGGGA